jgi:hypothetical protein
MVSARWRCALPGVERSETRGNRAHCRRHPGFADAEISPATDPTSNRGHCRRHPGFASGSTPGYALGFE